MTTQPTRYQQLQAQDRFTIAQLYQQKMGVREIARTLGRSPSTVSRELRRNSDEKHGYVSQRAHDARWQRRLAARAAPKLELTGPCWFKVVSMLQWRWSPQQIVGALKRTHPQDKRYHVSHETIYTAIYALPRGELRRQLISCLRHARSKRLPRSRGKDRRGQIPDMVSIHVRAPEIEERVLPGHWEGDFIKGAGNKSSVGVLVERTTRLVLLAKMEDATAASALAGFAFKLNTIAAPMRQSFTYHQGREMARHIELTAATGVKVYFCDPHSPWQRGTCENTNGLLRQYLPKGSDLSLYSQEELDMIADSLNNRPRATLDFDTPLAVFERLLQQAQQPSVSSP